MHTRTSAAVLVALLACVSAHAAPEPTDLRTEWLPGSPTVTDPCPDFSWVAPGQVACRVQVGREKSVLWDSGPLRTPVPVVEYAGPPLAEAKEYWWRVRVRDAAGEGEWTEAVRFTYRRQALPMVRPSIRSFMNFGGTTDFAVAEMDLVYRPEPNKVRPSILALQYSLLATMVVPSAKADALARFCVERGLTKEGVLEAMFAHFRTDTEVTLHVGAERASNPRETRLCPGWDPANDRNGDGKVDDQEAKQLANPKATAREMRQARVPIYYWGPPRDDYVMNVGHPAYQDFVAEVYCPVQVEGYDGLYIDTMPSDVAGAGRSADVLEFPRPPDDPDQWLHAMQTMLAKVKRALPEAPVTANCWHAQPLVIDGFQDENWMHAGTPAPEYRRLLDEAAAAEARGKIQMLQYNPIYDEKLSEFGRKLPISRDRDALFGLATYFLVHGDRTYYGFGAHPYAAVQQLWPKAAAADIGVPRGPYRVFARGGDEKRDEGENLLPNGGFEEDADGNGKPDRWQIAEPVALDATVKHSGRFSVRIASDARRINNINKAPLVLKPNTVYTLSCWMKTEGLAGEPGAQVYPYEFGGTGAEMLTAKGTSDWCEYSLTFVTGTNPSGRINFRVYGATGTAWFDDIRLTEGARASWIVFARDYTKALVLAKPYGGGPWDDSTATEHALPKPLRPLQADGTLGGAVRAVKLRSGEAAILVEQGDR